MSCFKNALIFGDQNFPSGDHFTKESLQKVTSAKLELEALLYETRMYCVSELFSNSFQAGNQLSADDARSANQDQVIMPS